jgi:nucleotide-binding universal stress UspA family protein
MYRLVMLWITDGSGGSGLSEEEFGGWAVKVNAAITFIEYTLTFLVSMAAMVTFIADRFPVLNESILGIQYRTIVAIVLSILTGWLVNRGPKTAARAFGPATAGVLLLLWAMIIATIWQYGFHLPTINWQAFSSEYLGFTFGGFTRMLAVMTGIEVFANLVAAYDGSERQKSNKAFGSLLIIMGTTAATMLIVGPAILQLSEPTNEHVSVFTQTMDQLLPQPLAYLGTLVGIAVLLSASAASAQGLQNLALGLKDRHYIPAFMGQRNKFDVADKPVWLEVGLVVIVFLFAGTNEETYLAIYAAGVFVLLSMTGWAAAKRLIRELRKVFSASNMAVLIGTVIAAVITTVATIVIFEERFFEGAWTYFIFVPLLYIAFTYFRRQLGDPSPIAEEFGKMEESMLGGFGFGQSFEGAAVGVAGGTLAMPLPQTTDEVKVADATLRRWQEVTAAPEHILVSLDGSSFAEQALPAAEALCLAYNAKLTLASVLPVQRKFRAMRPDETETGKVEAGRQERKSYLLEVAERMQAKGIEVEYHVLVGPVAESINHLMQEQDIDMSIISTHGRSGIQRWVLGSVANNLIQMMTRPVLIIRPQEGKEPPIPTFDKLLVTLDGSEFAERVLPYVRASTNFNSVVLLLTVPDVPEAQLYGAVVEEIEEMREKAEDEACAYLEGIANFLRAEGIETQIFVAGSRPAETIISIAEEEAVDVVMLATHGLGGLDRLFVGSVAERIVQHTHCPVFLVPIHERRPPI